MNQKLIALATLVLILTSIAGLAYSHWSDTIYINGTIKMAHVGIQIISYKNLTSKYVMRYSTITSELSADGRTLTITFDGAWPCWFVWVGLALQNKGTLPAMMKPPVYGYEDPNGFKEYFETKEYFYGPYPESTGFGRLEVWDNVKVPEQLRPDGATTFTTKPTTPPFTTDPGEKVVLWIWMHCKETIPNNAMGKTVKVFITIVDDLAV